MERIHQIDQQLTDLFADIEQVAHSLSFELIGDLPNVDRDALQFSGLYFIELWADTKYEGGLDGWLRNFQAAWDREEFKKCFVPSCQRARMKKHDQLREWMPIYLGKAEKIGRRIWEHLYLEKGKPTFALKLNARNLLEGNRYRLSVLRLPVSNYDVLAPKLEAALRRKYVPLVGRQ
jgi:hypothetical protein